MATTYRYSHGNPTSPNVRHTLPVGFQDVTIKRRILVTVVKDGKEEKEHGYVNQLAAEDLAEITQKPAQK